MSRVVLRGELEALVDQTYARRGGGQQSSEAELCSSPVSPLSVVPDFVVSLVSDPVRHRPVLLDLLGKSHLLSERLNGTLNTIYIIQHPRTIFLFINCY